MDGVFLRLAAKWEREATTPPEDAVEDGPAGAARMAREQGHRDAKKECAEKLRLLVSILGEA
ncbi:MAG: hypothetical protein ABFQ95_07335 [Pseudomonadota bacterium]